MHWGHFPFSPHRMRIARVLRAMLALALALPMAQPALAAPSDTATTAAAADVAVVSPLSLIKMKDMDFGYVAPLPTAGTVVLNPNDSTCTTTGGMLHVGTCQAAQFGGMGARNMIVRLNGPTTITLTGPGANMTVDTITLDTSPDLQQQANGNGNGNTRRYRIVSPTGVFSFNMGGTLHVNASQAPGAYVGTFSVTAVYQ